MKKNVVITGTSRGIGFELAQLFADDGHQVLALSRNEKPLSELDHPRITALPFDLTAMADYAVLKEWLEGQWKSVDVLIHNAGLLVHSPFMETSLERFREVYEVNVFGLVALTQVLVPLMPGDGHVLSIGSMGGVQGSAKFPGLAAYSSSKGALNTLTELLAEEFKETGPQFNVLALGAVQTEMLAQAFPGYQAPVTAREMAGYIKHFALTGHRFHNGKILPVSSSTP